MAESYLSGIADFLNKEINDPQSVPYEIKAKLILTEEQVTSVCFYIFQQSLIILCMIKLLCVRLRVILKRTNI